MQGNKKSIRGKFQQNITSATKINMDETGRKIWRVIAKWAGETGETAPLETIAKRLNMTPRTLHSRFANHLTWAMCELKVIREIVGNEEIKQIVSEYIG